MKPWNVLIVDDEPLARERLFRMLEKTDCSVLGYAENGKAALEKIEQLKPDVVFLDIRMPEMDGLQVAERVSKSPQAPAIIFMTAYDEYAVEAFRHKAQSYLLKPARQKDVIGVLEGIEVFNKAQQHAMDSEPATEELLELDGLKRAIKVKDLLYAQADAKYVNLVWVDGNELLDCSLKALELNYPDAMARVHRNTLVNLNRVVSVVSPGLGVLKLVMENEESISVSRRHISDVKKRLSER